MQEKIAILGAAGAIGKGTVPELLKRGQTVRVVGRDAAKLARTFKGQAVEIVSADLGTVEGCTTALSGVDAAIYSIGLPYFKKSFAQYPPMMRVCLEAANKVQLRKLILISNVYPYGLPQAERVREDHPRVPCSVKGEYRKQQEDIALAAHGKDGLSVLSLRLPDFYSADAEASLAWQIFGAAVKGKTANIFAPVETPHQFLYTPDIGPVIAELLNRPDLFGTAYNVAGDEVMSMHEFARKVYAEFGFAKPKYMAVGKTMLALLGIFSPILRELKEMSYLQERPVILDGGKLRQALPMLQFRYYSEGIKLTCQQLHK
jgi:nucleoside-diphosphate-sugar epimerase